MDVNLLLNTAALLLQLAAGVQSTDAKLLREARTAQVRFEGIRRMHLPRDPMGGSGSRCDARVGRYCYWYDSIPSRVVPEPRRIGEARAKLLAFLDSALARNPADGWLAGQRVRYLIEAGHPDTAVAAARACRAEPWWCSALLGLSLHVGERYAAADTAFAVALREMPAVQRCEWLDVRLLVEDRLASEVSRWSCAERSLLADRLWILGQPLWSTAGPDLRTEHFARVTMATILARSANPHGLSWGDDSRELLLRYGWAEWFTRQDPSPGLAASPAITGHDREPSYAFFPDVSSVRSVPRLTSSTWRLREATARARYAPRHVKGLTDLPHQLVRFPRGDSMLVAVAYRISDTALVRDSLIATLSALRNSELRVERPLQGMLSMTVPRDTTIMSVEVRGARTERAARARYTVDPLPCDGAWCLSDLLVFDPARGNLGTTLEPALSRGLTEMRFSTRGVLGLLWEIQGTPSSQLAWLSVTVEPVRVGLARRIATRLRLSQPPNAVRLRWRALLQDSLETQSTTLRLPPAVRGRYRVVLTVEPASGAPMSASREIEVVP